jgi:spermidine synthase
VPLAAAAVSGFLSVGYEVLWTRALASRFLSTVYSFAVILLVFLAALGAGSLLVGLLERVALVRRTTCAVVQLAAGIMGLVSILMLGVVEPPVSHAEAADLAAHELRELDYALLVMSGPVLLFGLNFPLLARLAHRELSRVGLELGRIYLSNTVGSVAAPLLVGFWLLPAIGLKRSLLAMAWGGVAFGLAVLLPWSRREQSGGAAIGLVSLAAAGVVSLLVPGDIRLWQGAPGDRLIEYREGISASVAVVADARGERVLKVNGHYGLGDTRTRFAQHRQGLIPLLLHGEPRRVLFLGVGTGSSAGAAAAYGGVAVDGLEILPELADLLPYFAGVNLDFMKRVAGDPDVRLLALDARHFVQATRRRYDVVVGDLFVPWRAGEGAMYTREHFQAVRDLLDRGGLFCQWLPLYQLGTEELKIIVATFCDVFPHAEVWWLYFNVERPAIGLIGSAAPLQFDRARLEERLAEPARQPLLADAGLADARPLLASYIAGRDRLLDFSRSAPVETRDRPRIEFVAPLDRFRGAAALAAENIDLMLGFTEPRWHFGGEVVQPVTAELAADIAGFQRAVGHYLRAQQAADTRERALTEYAEAVRAAPDWALPAAELVQSVQWALRAERRDLVDGGADALKHSRVATQWGHYYSAIVASQNGEFAVAVESLRMALENDPNHQPSRELLQRLQPPGTQ